MQKPVFAFIEVRFAILNILLSQLQEEWKQLSRFNLP